MMGRTLLPVEHVKLNYQGTRDEQRTSVAVHEVCGLHLLCHLILCYLDLKSASPQKDYVVFIVQELRVSRQIEKDIGQPKICSYRLRRF